MNNREVTSWQWIKKQPLLVTVPVSIILLLNLIFFGIYVFKFTNRGLSANPQDWSNTASYINMFIGILNMFVFIVLSLLVYHYNFKKDKSAQDFQEAIQRPILVLRVAREISSATIMHPGNVWRVKNIGNGAAMNLYIAYKRSILEEWEEPIVKGYSRGKEEELDLTWITNAEIICVIYSDIFGNEYASLIIDSETYVEELNSTQFEIVAGRLTIAIQRIRIIKNLRTMTIDEATKDIKPWELPVTRASVTSTSETTHRPDDINQ